VSVRITSRPAFAQAIAIPDPIVPAPTIATVRISAGVRWSVYSGSFEAARSAKNTWIRALACSPRTHSKKSSRSRRQPASNGSRVAASIASTAFSGATWWRRILSACARAAANSGALASASPRRSSRSLVFGCEVWPATRRANATADAVRSSPAISSTMPAASASCAVTGRPVTHMSSALATPARRGSRCVPSAPGTIPRFTSGCPIWAPASATR